MTTQTYLIDYDHPCKDCEGVRFFKNTKACIHCTKVNNAAKAVQTMQGKPHDWDTQGKIENTRSERFILREQAIMKGVKYG